MTEFKPPPLPWPKGTHEGFSHVVLEVHLCGDTTGRVWSYHNFQTPEDESVALGLPNAGAQQVAHALLTEAYRREAFVSALVEMSRDPQTLDRYRNGTEGERAALEVRITQASQEVMRRTLAKLGSGVPKEILAMLLASKQ